MLTRMSPQFREMGSHIRLRDGFFNPDMLYESSMIDEVAAGGLKRRTSIVTWPRYVKSPRASRSIVFSRTFYLSLAWAISFNSLRIFSKLSGSVAKWQIIAWILNARVCVPAMKKSINSSTMTSSVNTSGLLKKSDSRSEFFPSLLFLWPSLRALTYF